MTQQSIVKGGTQQKLGSAGFIIGAILFGISGLLMPHAAKPTSDLQEMLKPLGEHQFLTYFSSLSMSLGFWAVSIGAAGVYRSITTSDVSASRAAWVRFGFYLILIGTALWTVSLSLDMVAANAVADWLVAPIGGKEAAWSTVVAVSTFGKRILPMTWIVYWLALALLNTGMIKSDVYSQWLGWVGLIVSIPMIALGIVQVFTPRSITLTLIFSTLMLLTTLWDLATGIWIARKAW